MSGTGGVVPAPSDGNVNATGNLSSVYSDSYRTNSEVPDVSWVAVLQVLTPLLVGVLLLIYCGVRHSCLRAARRAQRETAQENRAREPGRSDTGEIVFVDLDRGTTTADASGRGRGGGESGKVRSPSSSLTRNFSLSSLPKLFLMPDASVCLGAKSSRNFSFVEDLPEASAAAEDHLERSARDLSQSAGISWPVQAPLEQDDGAHGNDAAAASDRLRVSPVEDAAPQVREARGTGSALSSAPFESESTASDHRELATQRQQRRQGERRAVRRAERGDELTSAAGFAARNAHSALHASAVRGHDAPEATGLELQGTRPDSGHRCGRVYFYSVSVPPEQLARSAT